MTARCCRLALLTLLLIVGAAAEDPATASFFGRDIVTFRVSLFGATPAVRAERLSARVEQFIVLAEKRAVDHVADGENRVIRLGEVPLLLLTPGDLDPLDKTTVESEAEAVSARLVEAMIAWGEAHDPRRLSWAVAWAVFDTAVLVAVLLALVAINARLSRWVEPFGIAVSKRLEFLGRGRSAGREALTAMSSIAARSVLLVLAGIAALVWATRVLGAFSYTRHISRELLGHVGRATTTVIAALIDAIPGLLVVMVICIIAAIIARGARTLIRHLAGIGIGWLDRDTALPTQRIASALVWSFAAIMAYPSLPFSGTDAFKGLTVLLGLMVSLGSTSAVGQAASGLVVLYTRLVRSGEWVRAGEAEGRVVKVGLFSTQIDSYLGERFMVPNVAMLSATTRNFSRTPEALRATIAVGIGYDAPWRRVHALLLAAVEGLDGIRATPAPRVRQEALGDFAVRYVLEFSPVDPARLPDVIDDLLRRAQDEFNDAGIQIMSPHFMAQPERPVIATR